LQEFIVLLNLMSTSSQYKLASDLQRDKTSVVPAWSEAKSCVTRAASRRDAWGRRKAAQVPGGEGASLVPERDAGKTLPGGSEETPARNGWKRCAVLNRQRQA